MLTLLPLLTVIGKVPLLDAMLLPPLLEIATRLVSLPLDMFLRIISEEGVHQRLGCVGCGEIERVEFPPFKVVVATISEAVSEHSLANNGLETVENLQP